MTCRHITPCLIVALAALTGSPVAASEFTVALMEVDLTADRLSDFLTLANRKADKTLRFEVTVFAWDMNEQGGLELGPTQDVVFSPRLVQLAAGEERTIRIAVTTPAGDTERTYRMTSPCGIARA